MSAYDFNNLKYSEMHRIYPELVQKEVTFQITLL